METLQQLVELRSRAYELAASGKHGDYPYDDRFNEEVEDGFSDDGAAWVAKDGTLLTIGLISLKNTDMEKKELLKENIISVISTVCFWEGVRELKDFRIAIAPNRLDVYCSMPNGEWYDEYRPDEDWEVINCKNEEEAIKQSYK